MHSDTVGRLMPCAKRAHSFCLERTALRVWPTQGLQRTAVREQIATNTRATRKLVPLEGREHKYVPRPNSLVSLLCVSSLHSTGVERAL